MATVWAVAVIGVLWTVALGFVTVGGARVVRHRTQTAADLTALAVAAQAVPLGADACRQGEAVAAANGARLERCAVVGPVAETAELRAAALALPQPDRRVWTLEKGGRIGPLTFPATDEPAAYVCGARSCSPPIHDGARLADAVQSIR